MSTLLYDTEPLGGVPVIRSGARATLTWDDGTLVGVYGRTVFGRDPFRAPRVDVVVLRDETLTVSRTHFELVPLDGRGIAVIDRASRNGVLVRRAGALLTAVAGARIELRSGDRLELGDRWLTVEVAR